MKKVLIVEDDIYMAKVYEKKVRDMGFETRVFYDGIGVNEWIVSNSPDLILLDMVMPKKDGYEILDDLKKSGNASTPVICLSFLSSEEDEKRALDLGASCFLCKTDTEFNQVVNKINELIGT